VSLPVCILPENELNFSILNKWLQTADKSSSSMWGLDAA
jgi:hypothetical protein